MIKYTVKEIKAFSNEALLAAWHNHSTHMAKEQSFPKWALKQEKVLTQEVAERFNLDLGELETRLA